MSTSIPSVDASVTACEAEWIWTIRPSHGARSDDVVGSIDTPSPTIFCAHTGSGTASSGTRTPDSGAFSTGLTCGYYARHGPRKHSKLPRGARVSCRDGETARDSAEPAAYLRPCDMVSGCDVGPGRGPGPAGGHAAP